MPARRHIPTPPRPIMPHTHTKLTISAILALGAVALSPTLHAQDKATLDLLVKKNVITQQEADSLAKGSGDPSIVVGPKDPNVKSLKLEGLIQSQFDWLTTQDKGAGASNAPAAEQFYVRRAYLGALADLGNGWAGEALFDFATGSKIAGGYQGGPAGITPQPNFEKIYISKKIDDASGTVTAGYRKVNFTLEEYTPSTVVKPVERSILSNYFDGGYKAIGATATGTRLGFASRHPGIFWDGTVTNTGFFYGVAVTNGVQSATSYTPVGGLNRLAGWAYIGYSGTLGDKTTYKAGINYGYTPDANTIVTQANSDWGYNPYVSVVYDKNAQVDAEFIQGFVTNGRGDNAAGTVTERAAPFGFNVTPSYKITPEWELVARYTYLFTDGRGVNISDVVTNANDVAGANIRFNDAQSIYVGVNWNIMGDSVKALFGYEWDEFTHRATAGSNAASSLTGPRAVVQGVRARVQLQF